MSSPAAKPAQFVPLHAPNFFLPQYWAACFEPCAFLPMSRAEMDRLGWDSCDIIIISGDAWRGPPQPLAPPLLAVC